MVRWVFAQRLAGHSVARIARALNDLTCDKIGGLEGGRVADLRGFMVVWADLRTNPAVTCSIAMLRWSTAFLAGARQKPPAGDGEMAQI